MCGLHWRLQAGEVMGGRGARSWERVGGWLGMGDRGGGGEGRGKGQREGMCALQWMVQAGKGMGGRGTGGREVWAEEAREGGSWIRCHK